MTWEGKVITGYYNRPWLNPSLFGLKNVMVNSKAKGDYSSGVFTGPISGLLALIPKTFIIIKDLKVEVSNRNK